ncbi:hypothetical protein [Methylobacterium sp. BTF04]|uniref:hypothetical protein n=1 Tax=Methylobacterium sp. BTF04 TaxID=2708300 RepID=UPI001954F2B0|nr:hypothetical protein [Methylobacterium sp. BTF04]
MTGGIPQPSERPTATVVTFPQSHGRRFRRPADDEAATRGAILLFTGIRYERMAEPPVPAPRLRRRS